MSNSGVLQSSRSVFNYEFTDAMRRLVIDVDAAEGQSLTVASLGEDKPRLVAAFLLVQSGELEINLEEPENIRLTESGRWLRQGIAVVTGT